jgi:Apea-like HEPN
VEIDTHNRVKVYSDQAKPYPNGLLNPYELQSLSKQQQLDKEIYIIKHFLVEDKDYIQKKLMNAIAEIESLMSWLSFITLRDFRILYWSEVQTIYTAREDKPYTSTIGRKFNLPIDSQIINESGDVLQVASIEPPIRLDNYENLLSLEIPVEIHTALRWYRKGLLSYFPEEKLIFWVTAIELISGYLSEDSEFINECPKCKHITHVRPSVNKSALFGFISRLGFNKNKTFKIIQKYRNKYAHGGVENFKYGSEDITIVTNATHALVVLFMSYCINQKKLLPSQYLKQDAVFMGRL